MHYMCAEMDLNLFLPNDYRTERDCPCGIRVGGSFSVAGARTNPDFVDDSEAA